MSNAIGRLRIQGISKQPTFGTTASTVEFFVPSDDAFLIEPIIRKEEDMAAMGVGYEVTNVHNTTRYAQFPLNFKISEDLLPLFFLQRFSDSVTDNLDSTYTHELTYTSNTNNWYTLFMQDDNRTDYVMQDVLFDGLNLEITAGGYINMSGTGIGHYPASGDFTVTTTCTNAFTGVEASFLADDFGGTVTSVAVETLNLNHTFNLSSEDRNFNIGNENLAFHQINQDRYETEFTGKLSDRTDYDIYTANTNRVYRALIQDTNRSIGTASTVPSIQFDYPTAYPIAYTDEGDLDTNLTFNSTYLPVYKSCVTNSPLKITVTNSTAAY